MSEEPAYIKSGKWSVYGWKAEAIGVVIVFLFFYGVISFALDVFA
jgi:hypothetical protein